jgi:hypothetical protein
MFQRYKERFGTAGVVVGVIALVLALVTGAVAAGGGLSGKQKKEVTKIAKKFAGRQGPQGAPGSPGATGTNGTNGKDGANGTNGKDGESVNVNAYAGAECEEAENEEGAKVGNASGTVFLCNGTPGREGSPWTAGGTLPSSETETGVWALIGAAICCGLTEPQGSDTQVLPISFNLPLPSALDADHVHFYLSGEAPTETSGCFHGTAAAPTADPGHLCIYTGVAGPVGTVHQIRKPSGPGLPGADTVGAMLFFGGLDNTVEAHGTWAVSAP